MENSIYEVLKSKYRIGENYIAAYLSQHFGSSNVSIETFNQKLTSDPNFSNWVDYALSTNTRGRTFVNLIRPYLPQDAKRYLDVGSAYGGFPIGFMELGLEVVGIEHNEKLVQLSRANFKDHGLEDASIKGDILDENVIQSIGKFDVITCIDVIEHVADVPQAMKNMISLLNPKGILILQMPNKDSISNIITDPHFGVFGLTLLRHSDARKLYFCYFPHRKIYDVGEFYQQGYYLSLLQQLDCTAAVLPPVVATSIRKKATLIPQYLANLWKFALNTSLTIPAKLRIKVITLAFHRIIEFIVGLLLAALFPMEWRSTVKRKFVDDAWFIIGTKRF